jgi:MFS family permease
MRINFIKKLTVASTVMSFALGFFAPFWLIYINKFGNNISDYGMSVGVMMIAGAIASFFVGKVKTSKNRKKVLELSMFLMSVAIFSYTIISTYFQLLFLQLIYGVASSAHSTAEVTILGDVTEEENRANTVGNYHFYSQIFMAISTIIAGYIGVKFGVRTVFYITSISILLAAMYIQKTKWES